MVEILKKINRKIKKKMLKNTRKRKEDLHNMELSDRSYINLIRTSIYIINF